MRDIYDRALEAASRKKPDLTKAHTLLVTAHESNDLRATYALATWFLHGKPPVVERNLKVAISMLRLAADQGNAQAAFDLAVCLEKGEGLPKSEKRAFQYYLKAALQGDRDSIESVGRMYYYGIGVPQDRKIARIWLDRALHHSSGPADRG